MEQLQDDAEDGVLLCIDLETTGLSVDEAEPVQFGAILFNGDFDEVGSFSELVMPEGDIDPEATGVHGHTKQSLVQDKAIPCKEALNSLMDWLSEYDILHVYTYNGDHFDVPIICRLLRQNNIDMGIFEQCEDELLGNEYVRGGIDLEDKFHLDVLAYLTREEKVHVPYYFNSSEERNEQEDENTEGEAAYKGVNLRCSLGNVHKELFKEEIEGAHEALADIRATMRVFRRIIELDREKLITMAAQHKEKLRECPTIFVPNATIESKSLSVGRDGNGRSLTIDKERKTLSFKCSWETLSLENLGKSKESDERAFATKEDLEWNEEAGILKHGDASYGIPLRGIGSGAIDQISTWLTSS